jgi:alanine-glyoxylate transaminase/serine-glyoxylate transaminase/serine-pyruvate transaminase
MSVLRGRNFLMTPGPSSTPERVLRAMARNSMDLGGTDFVSMTRACIDDLKPVFRTEGPVFAYISNGHGAWEAAVTNVIAAGDHVLVPSTGHFGNNWALMTEAVKAQVDVIPNDWRSAVDPQQVEDRLRADTRQRIKAVLLVHTDTATGISNDIAAVRAAIDAAGHPALLMVDAVASLGTVDFRMDEWGIDVTVAASQKGLMSPAGLGFTAVSAKALAAAKAGGSPRYYWDWQRRSSDEWYRWFCGTAPQQLLFALREALDMLEEEGMPQIIARHQRLAQMTRAAIECWSRAGAIELNARDPATASDSISAVRVAEHLNAWDIKRICGERFNVTLGGGLGQLDGKVFRIAHMGDTNEATILGALGAVEATLKLCDIPFDSGLNAAVEQML